MKRSGFTLIELIFVIVIIGVLAAVAVPKFKNLKQDAEAANVVKVAKDTIDSIPSTYVNRVDLEGDYNSSNVKLDQLVKVSGKNWTVDTSSQNDQTAIYAENNTSNIAEIHFNPSSREANITISCGNFDDNITQKKCAKIVNGDETNTTASTDTINF